MIVVTNRIPVAAGHEIDFEDRFRNRAHLIDQAPGFVRNEVHRPRPVKFDHDSGKWRDDPVSGGWDESVRQSVSAVLASLAAGEDPEVGIEEGRETLALIEASYRSAEEGCTIRMEEL